jgi:hypothetical protein
MIYLLKQYFFTYFSAPYQRASFLQSWLGTSSNSHCMHHPVFFVLNPASLKSGADLFGSSCRCSDLYSGSVNFEARPRHQVWLTNFGIARQISSLSLPSTFFLFIIHLSSYYLMLYALIYLVLLLFNSCSSLLWNIGHQRNAVSFSFLIL